MGITFVRKMGMRTTVVPMLLVGVCLLALSEAVPLPQELIQLNEGADKNEKEVDAAEKEAEQTDKAAEGIAKDKKEAADAAAAEAEKDNKEAKEAKEKLDS